MPHLNRLATNLERSLDYYRRENPQSGPIRRILLAADDPELEFLPMWLTEVIALEVTAVTLPACVGPAALLQAPDACRFLGAVGLAMVESNQTVDENYLVAGNWEVEVAGNLIPAIVSLRPLYDPGSARIKS